MRAVETPPDSGGTIQCRTSGSTGRPVTAWRSELAVMSGNLSYDRAWEAWGMDLAAPLAFISADPSGRSNYPDGGRYPHWSPLAGGRDISVLTIETPTSEQLDWLERTRPTNIMTYPVVMHEIAALAREKKSDLRLDVFVATGECLTAETRTLVRETFGCRVLDLYATREIGPIAFGCPRSTAYHVCSETMVCEIVDDDGLPVAPGEYGHVVVTPLYAFAMPFVRYDTGDYALKSRFACACGRGLPAIDRIGGRTRSMFIMPDGSRIRVRPNFISRVAEHLSYREIQLVQTTTETIEVRYVPIAGGPEPHVARLTALFREAFHPGMTLTLVPMDRIPRGAGMKFELSITQVAA
jgi:phenylacetate-CoA ligase